MIKDEKSWLRCLIVYGLKKEGCTYRALGKHMGITAERVRQLGNKAKKRLRAEIQECQLIEEVSQ